MSMQTRFDRQERLLQAIRLIGRIDLDVARVTQELIAGSNLTPGQLRILEALVENGRLTVAETARALSVKRQFAQRSIADMTASGLVETQPNPGHRRSFHCRATERGRQVHDTIRARQTALVGRHLGDVNMTEMFVTLNVLKRISTCFCDLAQSGAAANSDPASSQNNGRT